MAKPLEKDIFEGDSDSDEDIIRTENEYAKKYDVWRKKEELNKVKTKYGENVLEASDSSSSSEDDENAIELTEEVEKDFFKTLACLKKKDPKIYDKNVSFFKSGKETKETTKNKDRPMYLKDYERKLLLEKGGVISDEENEPSPVSYSTEQLQLKSDIIKLGSSLENEDEENDKIGGMLRLRQKTEEEKKENEAEYLKWLSGQKEDLQDKETESELAPLKQFWNNPRLDKDEQFLKDYILNKRYLDKANDNDYVPTYEEIVDESLSGDEKEIERQEEFEHKFNFRFEEPDQEFIKRYPRTIEQSLRKTDDKRKVKRAETKERKKKEKEEKMAEIKKLRDLKRQEIEEKLKKLKEVTGATDLGFDDEDIDGDFDPDVHDRKMQQLFNNDYYQEPEGDQKPEFPDIDEELEIENWDNWQEDQEPHCEDEQFNMDADYDPSASLKEELVNDTKTKRKRKRKSKVAEALSNPKPSFDSTNKDYEKYFDEYYKLDCEDIIGDLPCRFKYREVVPNDFGLSTEEILLANDKELNKWCSLKKTFQRRPENVEKYEQIAYAKKGSNLTLKKKVLPSLFDEGKTEKKDNVKIEETKVENKPTEKGKKKKAREQTQNGNKNDKIKKRKRPVSTSSKTVKKSKPDIGISDARLAAFGLNPKKYKNKLKYGNKKK